LNLTAFLSKNGVCSRRRAAELIKSKKVFVNGRTVDEPWYKIRDDDEVSVKGIPVKKKEKLYFLFNKPPGVTSTLTDRHAQKVIADFFPPEFGRLFPAGRLDKPTRGLILVTNDGDLCDRITHPRYGVEKEYEVKAMGVLKPEAREAARKGIYDQGELLKAKEIRLLRKIGRMSLLSVTAAEGKKRHIRRLLGKCGLRVADLKRVRIGGLRLGDLKEGDSIRIDRETVYEALLG
jgi:23S rRNA pseudouridine2605 synthase